MSTPSPTEDKDNQCMVCLEQCTRTYSECDCTQPVCLECAVKLRPQACPQCKKPYEEDPMLILDPPMDFVPTYDQEMEFEFDLLNQAIEQEHPDLEDEFITVIPKYSFDSLKNYFHQHFFLHKGYVYKWAGERPDVNHPFFKRPRELKQVQSWFAGQRGKKWDKKIIDTIPEHPTLTKSLVIKIPEGITEFPNIQPILDFDKDFCGGCEKQMMLFHQYLGMKLKYPNDIKRLSDKFIVFSGPQGNGKTTQITHKLHQVFGHQPYPAHMKDYGNKSIYNHATALNIIVDDAFSKVTTGPQTNTVKEMTSKKLVGGNIKNRSSTWFFVNDTHMHNIPMKNGRRCHIFRTGANYNRRWDLLKVVEETTTKYRDEYVAYLLSTVEGMENLNDCFADYEKEEIASGSVEVEFDDTDSPADRVRNYFKHDMKTNPTKYTRFPFKLPNAKQIVADTQALYESPRKQGMTAAVTGLFKAVVPKLRNNNKRGLYVVDSMEQLRSMAACCQIYGDSFETVFFYKSNQQLAMEMTFDDPESESEDEEVTTMADGIDEQEEQELLALQLAKQEELKQDREKQQEEELQLMRQQMQQLTQQNLLMQQQMQQGMAMMKQMASMQVPRPITVDTTPRALPAPKVEEVEDTTPKALPAPKQKAKLKITFKKK